MALIPPLAWMDAVGHRRRIAAGVRDALDGRTNGAGEITLTASATSTVVSDPRAGTDSVILFMPLTAAAATAQASIYVSSRGDGTFTVTHASDPAADQNFEYALYGTGRSP